MPVISFPKSDLPHVIDGSKNVTMRHPHKGLLNAKPGDRLVMQFGARTAPVTIRTTLEAVERVTPARVLAWVNSADDNDPRSNALSVRALTELLWASGDPEDFLMAYAAEFNGQSIIEFILAAKDCTKRQQNETGFILLKWHPIDPESIPNQTS